MPPHAGLVLEPLPVGAWALICTAALLASGAVTFDQAMSGCASESIWLVVVAFFFAKVWACMRRDATSLFLLAG
eukprot:225671-Chlamydomonas_euryale.AAC.1